GDVLDVRALVPSQAWTPTATSCLALVARVSRVTNSTSATRKVLNRCFVTTNLTTKPEDRWRNQAISTEWGAYSGTAEARLDHTTEDQPFLWQARVSAVRIRHAPPAC